MASGRATPGIAEQINLHLSDPMNLPPEFWTYMVQKWLSDAPVLPISQVFGFTQFTAQTTPIIVTNETTASTGYTDLATTGPSLTGLPDGNYLVFVGCVANSGDGVSGAHMSYSVNGGASSDNNSAVTQTQSQVSILTPSLQALSNNGSNTLTAKYRSSAGATCAFSFRSIIAIRYGNL